MILYTNLIFPSANDTVPSENTSAEMTERKTPDGRTPLSEACLQKELKKHREADKDGTQTIIVSEKQRCASSFQDVMNILVSVVVQCKQSIYRLLFTTGTLNPDCQCDIKEI